MGNGRRAQVVDSNVAIVANQKHGESSAKAYKCARVLLDIKHFGVIVLDDQDHILSEYRGYCSLSGQPGIGDSFIKWIHDNIGRVDLVQRVAITTNVDPPPYFHEFPNHPDLEDFDPSDQKFVAVANAHRARPVILQATDSKWWGWKDSLAECGIKVEFLFPEEIEETYRRKMERGME